MPLWFPSPSATTDGQPSSEPTERAPLFKSIRSAGRWVRPVLIRRLSDVQHVTAIPLAVFLAVHLAAPLVLPILGSDGASQVEILGREIYQTSATEPLLFGTFATHIVSGVLRRLLISSSPPSIPHALAYPLIPLLILHVASNRLSAPRPGGADFQFVKTGIVRWPVRAGLVYTSVVGLGLGHALGAGWAAYRRRFSTSSELRKAGSRWGPRLYGALALWICVGLGMLAAEVWRVPSWMAEQYLASWRRTPLYTE